MTKLIYCGRLLKTNIVKGVVLNLKLYKERGFLNNMLIACIFKITIGTINIIIFNFISFTKLDNKLNFPSSQYII